MRLTPLLLLVAIVLVASQPFKQAQTASAANTTRVFIQLDGGFRDSDGVELRNLGAQVRHIFRARKTISLDLPDNLLATLQKLPRFRALRLVPQVTAVEDTLPWGVDQINAERVWGGGENAVNVTPGANDGSGVVIAVVDSGIATHSDLNIIGGTSFVTGNSSYYDDNGHGTHVSGIAAARDNGTGVLGVAPGASLLAVKVLNSQGSGYMDDVAAGIEWAVDHGANVINMSLACTGNVLCNDSVMQDALTYATSSNVVIVAAAGNSGAGTNTVGWPAQANEVIAVAASCGPNNDGYCSGINSRASFSSTGPAVELTAPGDAIYSTYPGGYATLSGTSMASPHVAGAAALLVHCGYSAAQVRSLLDSTAIDLGAPGRDQLYGYGLVDLPAATASCSGGGSPTPTPTSVPGGPLPITDDFDSGTWSGGTGWAGAWSLTGTYSIYTSLATSPSAQSGLYQAVLRANGGITRVLSLAGRSTASLSFWAHAGSWEAGDGVSVQVSTNNTNWTTVRSFTNGFDDASNYQQFQVNLNAWAGNSLVYLRFQGQMNSYGDYFYVDSINISGTGSSSPTPTSTPVTPTSTPTLTPTATRTPTATATSTATATATGTALATSTPTATATSSPTATATSSPTATATSSPTATATSSPTATATSSPTATATSSPTATATSSPTATATSSPTATATSTATPTATSTALATSTPTATATSTPTPTATSTPTPTATNTATSTNTPTPTLTPVPLPWWCTWWMRLLRWC